MSEEQEQSSKTEEPSQRKLDEAKEKGNTFYSKELSSFLSLLTFAIIFSWLGKTLSTMYFNISLPLYLTKISVNIENFREIILQILLLILIPTFTIMIANVGSSLLQKGIIYAPKVIKPDLQRISIFSGIKRMFSLNSLFELMKGIIKISFIGLALYLVIEPDFPDFYNSYLIEPGGIIFFLIKSIDKIMLIVCIITFFLGVGDYFYQKYSHHAKMKMTKEEVKEEHKRQEGSPEIKSKIKSMIREKAKRRMMASVPKADVIITNPTHYAVALEYKEENMQVPKLIAKGVDEIAAIIKKIAEDYKIPIVENPSLARSLYRDIDVDQPVQHQHYQAVAEVIAYVMKMSNKRKSI